jgi:hypothetical protein
MRQQNRFVGVATVASALTHRVHGGDHAAS